MNVGQMSVGQMIVGQTIVGQMIVGQMNCRSNELSVKWTVGQMNCRSNELSVKWMSVKWLSVLWLSVFQTRHDGLLCNVCGYWRIYWSADELKMSSDQYFKHFSH